MKIVKILLVVLICSIFVFGIISSVSREMDRREYSKTNRELIVHNRMLIKENKELTSEIKVLLCKVYANQPRFCKE